MNQPFETHLAKSTELFQTLFGLGVQNAQTVISANQKAFETAVAAMSTVGQVPDFSEAVHAYQEAGEVISANMAEARRVLENAAHETRDSVRSAIHSGINKLEEHGLTAVADAVRSSVAQAETAQEQVAAQVKTVEEHVEKAQAEVKKQVKAAVAKAQTATKTATATAKKK